MNLELIDLIPIIIISIAAINHISQPLGYDIMNLFTKDANKQKMLYTVVGLCGIYIMYHIIGQKFLVKQKEDFQMTDNCEGCECTKDVIEKANCVRCLAMNKGYSFENHQCM